MRDAPDSRGLLKEFWSRLEALGWADGRNIRADYRWIVGDIDRIGEAAKEIVEQRPEVIVTESTVTVAALSRESGAIPIVFVNVSDPIASGFVTSLARPGGMITGFTSNEPTLGGKWPELLKEIAPNVRRIGLLFDPDTAPYAEAFLRQAEASARTLGIDLFAARIHGRTEIERTMTALAGDAGSGLIVLPDVTTNFASDLIIESAARHRIPAIYAWEFEAIAGGPDVLWHGYRRIIPWRGRLRRSYSSGHRACRPSGAGADQIQVRPQFENRKGVGHRGADRHSIARRRVDRMTIRRRGFIAGHGSAAVWSVAARAPRPLD
jgi:hypothetical protein